MALEEIGTAIYYVYIALGSVSLGYLLLRLSYPEIRTFTRNEKLGASALAGIVLSLIAIVIDTVANPEGVLAAAGFLPVLLFAVTGVAYFGMRLFYGQRAAASTYITVGVPVTGVAPIPAAVVAPPRVEKFGAAPKKREEKIAPPAIPPLPTPAEAKPALVRIPIKPQEIRPRELAEIPKLAVPTKPTELLPPAPKPLKPTALKAEILPPLAAKPPAEAIPEAAKALAKIELPKLPKPTPPPAPSIPPTLPTLAPPTPTAPPVSAYREAREKARPKEEAGPPAPPRRRLYALPPEEREKAITVVAPAEIAEKEELKPAIQEVYKQLQATKKPERPSLREVVEVKKPTVPTTAAPIAPVPRGPPAKPARAPPAPPAPEVKLTLEEILGGAAPPTGPTKKEEEKKLPVPTPEAAPAPAGLFAELEAIATGKPPAAPAKKAPEKEVELVKVQAEKGMACPSCGTQGVKVVFCPYCGTANCSNCARNLIVEEDRYVYTCHNCGEEFIVKKKPPLPTPATS